MKFLDKIKSPKNQKNENIFNVLPDAIFVLAKDGKILDVNEKVLKIFKEKKFNIVGNYFSKFISITLIKFSYAIFLMSSSEYSLFLNSSITFCA